MRPSPDVFIERIGNEIDILESSQLDPPLLVIRKFEQKYGAVHRILYGDDIVELMKIELQANTLFKKIKSSTGQRLSDVSSSEITSPHRIHRTVHTSLRGSDKHIDTPDTTPNGTPDKILNRLNDKNRERNLDRNLDLSQECSPDAVMTKQQSRFDLDSFTDDIAMDISRYPGDVLQKNPQALNNLSTNSK